MCALVSAQAYTIILQHLAPDKKTNRGRHKVGGRRASYPVGNLDSCCHTYLRLRPISQASLRCKFVDTYSTTERHQGW